MPREAQRRDLVTPFAVVALVVRVQLRPVPAGCDERAFDRVDPVAWNENVDICEQPAFRDGELLDEIGGALQQGDRYVDRREHTLDPTQLEPCHLLAEASDSDLRFSPLHSGRREPLA